MGIHLRHLMDLACVHYCGKPAVIIAPRELDQDGYAFPLWRESAIAVDLDNLSGAVNEHLSEAPVVLLPPWTRSDYKGSLSTEKLLLDCKPASPDSLLMVLVPSVLMTGERYRRFRQELWVNWAPVLLLYAEGALDGVHSSFRVVALFLRNRERKESTKLFNLTPGTVSLEDAERDFKRLLVKRDGTVVHGYVLVEEPGPGDSLSFNRYEPALIAQRSALSSFGPTKPLGELFEISMGRFLAPEHVGLMVKVDDPRGIRVIRGRDILRDETIAPVEDDAVYVNFPDDRCLQVGDILIRSIGRLTDFGGLVCAEITESDLPAVADSKVLILRCAAPMPRSQRSIVLQFLRTPLAKKIAYVDEGYHLTIATLKNLPVPQLDDNLLAAWDNLESARTRFDVWRMEADAVLSNIFAGESSKAARSQLISSGRNLRLRSNAAAAMDDESYIFRTRFPYPVAYRWRVMEAEKSAREYKDAYVAVLDTAETLASYIALVSLGLAREAGLNLGYVGNIREKLKRDVGPSFGDWIAILREISKSRAVRSASSSQALSDLRQVAANREADAALGRLADKRNDEAHLRRVASGDLPPAFEDALADLVVLMNAALVVTDIPLVQIVSVQWDSFQRSALVQLREFMGDHSVISSQFIRYPSSELEVGSLYVMDDHRELHLLRPYLVGNDCPKCHMWSTFHVDGASQNFVTMKSLEHGHLFKDENLPNALRHVGLL